MNRVAQPLFTRAATSLPPPYEVLKEEQEVVLGETLDQEPLGPAPVRSTVINIRSDIAVPDHVVWSLFNTLFMNFCCLGLAAFAYSVKSRDRKMVGDVIGAQSYASTAKCLNIFALILSLLVIVLLIILIATGTVLTAQAIAEVFQKDPGY